MSMADEQGQANQWADLRRRMVEEQIRCRNIDDPRVLEAMLAVPRERFLPEDIRAAAYEDRALPIGHEQTISQPFIVAYMTQELSVTPEDRVLEIGTGTGYQTAILALLAREVFTVERIPALQDQAARNLSTLALDNIVMHLGDGSLGLPEHAPYDRIIATAAAPSVPPPLVDQLVDGGVLVLPVGGATEQTIVRIVRKGRRTIEKPTLPCRFVKLIGHSAWHFEGFDA